VTAILDIEVSTSIAIDSRVNSSITISHHQCTESPPNGNAVRHRIHRPPFIRSSRCIRPFSCFGSNTTLPLSPQRMRLFCIDPFYLFVIHHISLSPEEDMNTRTAVSWISMRKEANPLSDFRIIFAFLIIPEGASVYLC
jgi:hypothetical protein